MTSESTSMDTPQYMEWSVSPPTANATLFGSNQVSMEAPLFPEAHGIGRIKPGKVVSLADLCCRKCDHVSSRKKDVARHELTHAKGDDKERWICGCGKGYGRRDNLQRHQRTSCRRRA
jgi:hypothetical protein